jgi:hypothetical protein
MSKREHEDHNYFSKSKKRSETTEIYALPERDNVEPNEFTDWPSQISTTHKFKCLKNFDNNTNYKKLYREVCCICGQINIAKEPLIPQNINFLSTHKNILHKNNILYLKECELQELKYQEPFNVLNDLILDETGFRKQRSAPM